MNNEENNTRYQIVSLLNNDIPLAFKRIYDQGSKDAWDFDGSMLKSNIKELEQLFNEVKDHLHDIGVKTIERLERMEKRLKELNQ